MKKWITCILCKAELPGVRIGPHNSPWKPSVQLEPCWPPWWLLGTSYGAGKQLLKIMALIKSKMTETHSLSQRRPAVPSGQVQVLCGLQVAPCWQGGTQGIVTATGRSKKDGREQKGKRRDSCRSVSGTLTCFTHLAHKPVSTTTPVEAHTHAAIPARFLTLNQLWGKQTEDGIAAWTHSLVIYSMLAVSTGSSTIGFLWCDETQDRCASSPCALTCLATSPSPPSSTRAFVDVDTSSPVLTGRSAERCRNKHRKK